MLFAASNLMKIGLWRARPAHRRKSRDRRGAPPAGGARQLCRRQRAADADQLFFHIAYVLMLLISLG
jgi:hypothetical protein